HGCRYASEDAVQSRLALAEFLSSRADCNHAVERNHVPDSVLHRARKRARHTGTAFRHTGAAVWPAVWQTAPLLVRGIFRAMPDLDVHAIHFPRADPWQRLTSRPTLASLSLCRALPWNSDFQ